MRAALQDHSLDVLPSDREAAALRQPRDGDRIVVTRGGGGHEWEKVPDLCKSAWSKLS
jgi:hypothetical protein